MQPGILEAVVFGSHDRLPPMQARSCEKTDPAKSACWDRLVLLIEEEERPAPELALRSREYLLSLGAVELTLDLAVV